MNTQESIKHNKEKYYKLVLFIREIELKKQEFSQHGIFMEVAYIPAKIIFTIKFYSRALDLLKLFLYNSVLAEDNKTVMDGNTSESIKILISTIEGRDDNRLEILKYGISIFSPSFLGSIAASFFFKLNDFTLILAFILGGLTLSLVFNYLEYKRIASQLKTRYLTLENEINDLIK